MTVTPCPVCRQRAVGIPKVLLAAHLAQCCTCGRPLGGHAADHPHATDQPDPASVVVPCPGFTPCLVCASTGGELLPEGPLAAGLLDHPCGDCGQPLGAHGVRHPHPGNVCAGYGAPVAVESVP